MQIPSNKKESSTITRFRKKIEKTLKQQDKLITPEAVSKALDTIRMQITRNAVDRVPLKEKKFSLFDENRHPSQTMSKFVNATKFRVVKETRNAFTLRDYYGRIKKKS